MKAQILNLLLMLSTKYEVPPALATGILMVENPTLKPNAVNQNVNGTLDRGLMQLNNSWYISDQWYKPEHNIEAAMKHIRYLMIRCPDYYTVAIAYNAGLSRVRKPPKSSIKYADKVFEYVRLYYERRV